MATPEFRTTTETTLGGIIEQVRDRFAEQERTENGAYTIDMALGDVLQGVDTSDSGLIQDLFEQSSLKPNKLGRLEIALPISAAGDLQDYNRTLATGLLRAEIEQNHGEIFLENSRRIALHGNQ